MNPCQRETLLLRSDRDRKRNNDNSKNKKITTSEFEVKDYHYLNL